jgi:hypothetical protein
MEATQRAANEVADVEARVICDVRAIADAQSAEAIHNARAASEAQVAEAIRHAQAAADAQIAEAEATADRAICRVRSEARRRRESSNHELVCLRCQVEVEQITRSGFEQKARLLQLENNQL